MILVAASIAEAQRRMEQSALPIDWIMIDAAVSDGLSFAEEIRTRRPEIGVLFTAGYPFESRFRVLQKPFDVGALWAALAR